MHDDQHDYTRGCYNESPHKKVEVDSSKVIAVITFLESSRNFRYNKGKLKNKEVAQCNNITLQS